MDKEQIKGKVLDVAHEVMPELNSDVDTEASLTDGYDVDSVSMIRMLVGIEKEFGVSYDDSELALYKYNNFDDVIESVEKKLS